MSTPSQPWLNRLDDKINPIVVKELRQAINGRFIASILMLFLLISLATVAAFLLSDTALSDFEMGRSALMTLQGILLAVCLLFLPAYAGVRLAAERSDVNVDLMFITTIPARAIVWGKLLASLILAGLIYSACMPFMTVTFLMRGVDLPSILIVLVISFVIVSISVMLGLLVASISTNRGLRILLALGLLGAMGAAFAMTMEISYDVLQRGIASSMGTKEFWLPASVFALIASCVMALLYVWTVALVRPPSANRMLPVRITTTIVWALMGMFAIGNAVYYLDSAPVEMWVFFSGLFFGICTVIAVCERESWGPRVASSIPRNPVLRRIAFVFYSGAAGGLVWAWLGFVLTIVIGRSSAEPILSVMTTPEIFSFTVALMLYFYAFAMTAMLVRRYLLSKWLRPEHTWTLAVVMALLLIIVSASEMGMYRYSSHSFLSLLNPFIIVDHEEVSHDAILLYGSYSTFLTIIALPWILGQIRLFRPPVDHKQDI